MLEKNRSCSEKRNEKEKRRKMYGLLFSGPSNPHTAGSLQRSADAHLPRSAAQARSLPPLALRLGPRDRIFRPSAAPPRRRPATEGQSQARRRRRRLRPCLRPPRTGRRPCVRTSLSSPASAVPVGARPAAQGGRALAPPVNLRNRQLLHILLGQV